MGCAWVCMKAGSPMQGGERGIEEGRGVGLSGLQEPPSKASSASASASASLVTRRPSGQDRLFGWLLSNACLALCPLPSNIPPWFRHGAGGTI